LVSGFPEESSDTAAEILLDVDYMLAQVEGLQTALEIVVGGESDREYVCWAETRSARAGGVGWALRAAPVDVGPALSEALYRDAGTVVLTSATLTVEGAFDYMRRRVGLDSERERLVELTVPSPFDYPNQLLMCVPTDIPLPGDARFAEVSHEAIFGAATAAGGGTLCLFTSRDSMVRAHKALAPRLAGQSLNLLCQDVHGTRTALLERLREDRRAVLFGLKSFWEGIDVPGEALRCLVIVKLPFAVPSDPVIAARQERVQEEGHNGYDEYYVPNAIIGFRQGVGRLIRTQTDRGAVLILDRRVLLRRYGPRFLASVPECRVLRARLERCVEAVGELVGGTGH
jgi:ATP-dependent DNA helicase DinG